MTGPRTVEEIMHTPGPWNVGLTLPEGAIRIECDGGPFIASVRFSANRDEREAQANASLIAAAPELLEALASMVEMFERHMDGRPGPDDAAQRWDAARAAISKAEGRS